MKPPIGSHQFSISIVRTQHHNLGIVAGEPAVALSSIFFFFNLIHFYLHFLFLWRN
eukprot:UN2615